MPFYEYECRNGHRFTNLQPTPGQPGMSCPVCEFRAQKLVTACDFASKSMGFHATDHDKDEPKTKKEKRNA